MMSDIQWGPKKLSRGQGTEHFLVVGASGSGKTTLLKMMLRSVFEAPREFTGLIYDPKQDLLPILFDLRGDLPQHVAQGTSSVRVLNPLDARCCAWALHKDITDPVSAKQLAAILVPESESAGNGDQFFVNAVRDILAGVMLIFIKCAKDDAQWTFRDLILGCLYRPYLKVLLQQTETRDKKAFPLAHRLKSIYLDSKDERTVSNILSTISAKLSIYEPIAASWHAAEQRGSNFTFSLAEWASGAYSDILVLGNSESGRAAIDPINQAIFKRATELLLAREEASKADKEAGERQTWLFLDEVREAGKLDGLSRLLTKGRSKGACVVLSFQDIEGLRSVYGEEVANEICGQCNNGIVLRLNSPSTAQWASEMFGRRITASKSVSSQSKGLDIGTGSQESERPYLMTSDFTYLPTAGFRNGIWGYLRDPEASPDEIDPKWNLTPSEIDALLPSASGNTYRTVEPIDPDELYLEPWTETDWDRLGFSWPFNAIAENADEAKALGLKTRLSKI